MMSPSRTTTGSSSWRVYCASYEKTGSRPRSETCVSCGGIGKRRRHRRLVSKAFAGDPAESETTAPPHAINSPQMRLVQPAGTFGRKHGVCEPNGAQCGVHAHLHVYSSLSAPECAKGNARRSCVRRHPPCVARQTGAPPCKEGSTVCTGTCTDRAAWPDEHMRTTQWRMHDAHLTRDRQRLGRVYVAAERVLDY